MDCSLPGSSVHGDSPSKNIGVGCHALLQRIFPTQGSNPGLPHCRQIVYHLSHQNAFFNIFVTKWKVLKFLQAAWGYWWGIWVRDNRVTLANHDRNGCINHCHVSLRNFQKGRDQVWRPQGQEQYLQDKRPTAPGPCLTPTQLLLGPLDTRQLCYHQVALEGS